MTQTTGTGHEDAAALTSTRRPNAKTVTARRARPKLPGRQDWASWPHYQAAEAGFRGYWYPVMFANQVGERPVRVKLLGEDVFVVRDKGKVYGMANRCPHRGVPLSLGNQQFPGTELPRYHGWTYPGDGELCAVITDGPESPICGKVTVARLPRRRAAGHGLGLLPRGDEAPPSDR